MSTKQIHPYVRECQQFYKQFRHKWTSSSKKNKHRNRNWWKAYYRTRNAEWGKEQKDEG